MQFEYSAGAFVYKKEKEGIKLLFLIKENGEYDLPKGHIEKDESAEEAAKREIEEETGLVVSFLKDFSISTKYFFTRSGKVINKNVKYFIAKVDSPNVRISYEHIGYVWLEYEKAIKKIKFKNMLDILSKVVDYIDRYEKMSMLNEEYAKLPMNAKGWDLSDRHVPGEGPLNAEIMAIGQAPGKNEDDLLRPFVGRCGRLLSELLKKSKIDRDKMYITSVVQFFPPKNRMPGREEVDMCKPFLIRQIEIIKPHFIILLGSLSNKELIDVTEVAKNHGQVIRKDKITYMVTFHPAAALRFKSIKELMGIDLKNFSSTINAFDGKLGKAKQ